MPGLTFPAKVAAARAAGRLLRASGRGGGTTLPGKLLLSLEHDALGVLSARLRLGSVAISATNGKTSTAAMVAAVLEARGERLVHNRAGANMAGGVASALLDAARRRGGIDGDRGLFEVDEFWLADVAAQVRPRALLLGNLFRDQLDRYGELETIGDRWAEVVAAHAGGCAVVLNADDPLVADLGRDGDAPRPGTTWFGVEDRALALPELQHASDSKHCRRCGAPYEYELVLLGHLGHYHCPSCGMRRPEPEVTAHDVALHGTRSASFTLRAGAEEARVELPLPGLYNVYNALGAAALCRVLGVPLAETAAALAGVSPAFGRAETIAAGAREMVLLLVKNPAGANEVLRTLALEDPGAGAAHLDLLAILNDHTADGRDVSWVWDADFELLRGRVRTITCAGTRAGELAVRLKYAGIEEARMRVVPALDAALDAALAGGEGTLHVLPTYTALLELRGLLTRRGLAPRYWASAA